jgi:hypothetical protein
MHRAENEPMTLGAKTGGRTAGTPNKATTEVRALASAYGPEAIEELAKLAGIAKDEDGNPIVGAAQSDQARISALEMLLSRGYGRSQLSMPIEIELPDTSTPEGAVKAVAVILAAAAKGDISPAQAKDLGDLVEIQRRAIETNDHEVRLKRLEAAGTKPT